MRLIDADALSEKLCETTIFIKDGEVFQRMINDAPTLSAETHDKRTETHGVCSDLIRRSDAIETAYQLRHKPNDAEWTEWLKSFNAIPSAEPPYQYSEAYVNQLRGERDILQDMVDNMAEPKTGEWVSNHDGSWNCSECGLRVFVYAKGNYCPNCGTKMYKGGDDE